METNDYQKITKNLAPMLNALSHPARLQIMLHLAKYNGCQAGSISERLPLAKSTVSEHLNKLKEVGLITCTNEGTYSNYRINDKGFNLLKTYFNDFLGTIELWQGKQTDCCPVQPENAQQFAEV
jgi:ArsR family transcriptional regulator, arsenate/arsenite/antimonite-responsive transcriptional repressor